MRSKRLVIIPLVVSTKNADARTCTSVTLLANELVSQLRKRGYSFEVLAAGDAFPARIPSWCWFRERLGSRITFADALLAVAGFVCGGFEPNKAEIHSDFCEPEGCDE